MTDRLQLRLCYLVPLETRQQRLLYGVPFFPEPPSVLPPLSLKLSDLLFGVPKFLLGVVEFVPHSRSISDQIVPQFDLVVVAPVYPSRPPGENQADEGYYYSETSQDVRSIHVGCAG